MSYRSEYFVSPYRARFLMCYAVRRFNHNVVLPSKIGDRICDVIYPVYVVVLSVWCYVDLAFDLGEITAACLFEFLVGADLVSIAVFENPVVDI
jgi:hypothetical protein